MVDSVNHRVYLSLVLVAILAAAIIVPAYAISISGTVREVDFSLIDDAKVTAERVEEYQWDRTSSAGAFSIGVDSTNDYDVDAMKGGYEHNRQEDVAGGSTNVPFILDTQDTETLDVYIAADEDFRNAYGTGWQDEAEEKLRLAEGWFWEEHSIEFNVVGFTTGWTSQAALANVCGTFANDMESDLDWPDTNPNNADILFGITGETVTGIGCATNTSAADHAHPTALVQDSYEPADLLVMHELTHLYDYDHQCDTDNWYDVMESSIVGGQCTGGSEYRIKNWKPAGDDIMEQNRDWY
jgi:hypothetical protein